MSFLGRFHAAFERIKEEAVIIDKFNIDYKDLRGK